MLSERLRSLREAKGLVQRQVAEALDVDITYISRMENNEKPVSRHHLKKLAKLLVVPEKELHILWLTDKVIKTVQNEELRQQALQLALKTLQ